MAQTKVKLVSNGVITVDNLHVNHGITTDHIGEGSVLYYTDARVQNYLTTNNYATEAYVSTTTTNSANWDTAYSWGDHSLAGYLTSFTETDPIYVASSWYTTTNNATNWDTAFGWGNHASQGYATQTYVNTAVAGLVDAAPTTLDTLNELAAALGDDPNFATTVSTSIGTKWTQDNTKISNWDTAYSWGNHASASYASASSLSNYLPLTGGTLSGTLISGTATPTGSVIGNIRSYGSTSAYMGASDAAGRTAFFGVDSSGYAMFGAITNHDTVLRANNNEYLRVHTAGYTTLSGSARSPIFYDSNNTGYYVDPASTSNLNSITVNGSSSYYPAQNFYSNLGGYLGASNSPALQAYSTANNSAYMSFHKGGYYAVNMGLDADNVFRIGGWSAAANRLQLDMSGNLTMAGDVTAYSDARVKENVVTIDNALDKVKKVRGVYYNRTDSEDTKTKIGVIAQELLEVLPEVVNQDNDGMYNVSYGNITALLIEAIKEQQQQIDELKSLLNK